MTWATLITNPNKLLNHSGSGKEWFEKLIENIERHKNENNSIPFKITRIVEKGFIVKVSGLFAFVSFNHMPWKYSNFEIWKVVFPKIVDKVFFCKVYKINKYPLSIIINGEIPQFKKIVLFENYEYKGIVIKKTNNRIFIDIGYHYEWEFGSLVGVLHKSQIDNIELFHLIEIGHELKIRYQGKDENGQLIFGENNDLIDLYIKETKKLIGEMVWVKVKKVKNKKKNFLVENKFKALLPTTRLIYPKHRKEIIKAKNALTNGEIIHCEVLCVNKEKKCLTLKWIYQIDTTIGNANSIQNILDEKTLQQLKIIKKETEE